jgi:hypothetical protein
MAVILIYSRIYQKNNSFNCRKNGQRQMAEDGIKNLRSKV